MQVNALAARPPHIRFVALPVENRTESIAQGHAVFKSVDHVVLTPQGSKDSITKVVAEWLANSDQQVQEERLPAEWAMKFHAAYEHWKRGEEIPVEGTALVNWPAISVAEILSCKSIHILTVEELAAANDEATRRLGMGGLALKQRAAKYLHAAAGPGKLMVENADLRAKFNASEERRMELEGRMAALEAAAGIKSPVKVLEGDNDEALTRKL